MSDQNGVFTAAVLAIPGVGMTVLWLTSSDHPTAVSVGWWCAVVSLVVFAVWAVTVTIREGQR